MDWLRRIDVIVLVSMLSYAIFVAARVFLRLQIVGDAQRLDDAGQRKLSGEMNVQGRRLKFIASVAPYLGLLGTVLGILNAPGIGTGIAMEKSAALRLITSGIAESLVTSALAILVTVPAICSYNYLGAWIDLLDGESGETQRDRQTVTRSHAPSSKSSGPPAFSLVAASGLAILVAAYTPYFDPHRSTGLGISLVSSRGEYVQNDRVIVLHVTNASKLFINDEEEGWRTLASRLSEIYSTREHRALYLLVDEEVSFQTVADVIDIVASDDVTTKTKSLNIEVRLITPAAMKAGCVAIPSRFVPILHGPA